MSKNIQANIKHIRRILGCTQGDLAETLGVSRPTINKVEQGTMKIPKSLTITFIVFVIYNHKQLDNESTTYKLLSVYIDDFERELLDIISVDGV